MWNEALAPYKRKTSQRASKFLLKDIPKWQTVGRAAFHAVKDAMATAITQAYFDPDLQTCVFSDANEEFWCLGITQCKSGDEM